jgi:hypothetical protein
MNKPFIGVFAGVSAVRWYNFFFPPDLSSFYLDFHMCHYCAYCQLSSLQTKIGYKRKIGVPL